MLFQHTATRRWLPKRACFALRFLIVSTHSHPKVAALKFLRLVFPVLLFQHTATRRWLLLVKSQTLTSGLFQHTATRRWLHRDEAADLILEDVSTHSHPKVAAIGILLVLIRFHRFNTQPPEGGCLLVVQPEHQSNRFNTQPPEGGCQPKVQRLLLVAMFQHTATRRWLPKLVLLRAVFELFQHTATRRWLQAGTR